MMQFCIWTAKQALEVLGLLRVWIFWYVISNTDREEGYWDYTIYNRIYLLIPINLLRLEIKGALNSWVLSIGSVSNSMRTFFSWSPELYVQISVQCDRYIYHSLNMRIHSTFTEQVVDWGESRTIVFVFRTSKAHPIAWWIRGFFW
jgi:hypothetical protein